MSWLGRGANPKVQSALGEALSASMAVSKARIAGLRLLRRACRLAASGRCVQGAERTWKVLLHLPFNL